ncbi:MAG: hypothetical protein WCI91_03185, partial [Candidatus Nomurabacteria bacterium]
MKKYFIRVSSFPRFFNKFNIKNILILSAIVLVFLGIGVMRAQAVCTMAYCSGLGTGTLDGYAVTIGLGDSSFTAGQNMNVVTASAPETQSSGNKPAWGITISIMTDDGQNTSNSGSGFKTFIVPTTTGTHTLNFNGTFSVPYLDANGVTWNMG